MHFLMFIVIGLIAGALAGRVVSGHGYGLLGDIILGGVGALLGGWMFAALLRVGGTGVVVSPILAFVGATGPAWPMRVIAPLPAAARTGRAAGAAGRRGPRSP